MRRTSFLFFFLSSFFLPPPAVWAQPDLLVVTDLVFVTDREGNNEIYSIDMESLVETRLTNDAGTDDDPNVSPDGSKVIFTTDRDGNFEIYSMNADGTSQTRLTNDAGVDVHPGWSPTGKQIVFETNRDGNDEIYVMDFDGMNPTRLTSNPASDTEPRWSPDGAQIVFTSDRDGNDEVYVMNADGTGQTNLTNVAGNDGSPTWSPDGRWIAFMSDRDGNDEVGVMNADGTGQTNLTNDPGDDIEPSWSPDGTKFTWATDREGNTNVYIADFDGRNPFPVTKNAAADGAPSWGPYRLIDESPSMADTKNLRIFNRGSATLNVSSIASANSQFTFAPSSFAVPSATGVNVTVTYGPTVSVTTYSVVTITSDDPKDPTANFVLNGTGGPPIIRASVDTIDFDSVGVGMADTALVAIRNVGSGLLMVSDLSTGGGFGITTSVPQTVLVGDSLVVGVTFSPLAVGGETTALLVTHDDLAAPNPLVVSLSGFGTDALAVLQAALLDFGPVRPGTQGQRFVTIENHGTQQLSIAASFGDSFFSVVDDSLVIPVGAGSHGSFEVLFTPDSVGTFQDTLVLTHNGSNSPLFVPLDGFGIPPPAPLAALLDSTLVFSDIQVGDSQSIPFNISNPGDDTLRVTSILVANPAFDVDPDTLLLLPNEEGRVTLTFSPSDTGVISADVILIHNAVTSPDTVWGKGRGIQHLVTLSHAVVDFGPVEPGFPLTLTIVLRNDSPVSFSLDDFAVDAAAFSVDAVLGAIDPGMEAEIHITFDPDGAGTFSGSLQIVHDDPFGPFLSVELEGLGAGESFDVLDDELVFVNPGVGGEARDTLRIDNRSGEVLVLGPSVTDPAFRIDPPDSLVLPPGVSGLFLVVFVADSQDKRVETLQITHNAVGRPDLTIPLFVVAGTPDLVLEDVEIDFGDVRVAEVLDDTMTIENPGTDTLFASLRVTAFGSPFSIDPNEVVVPPGETWDVVVTFAPLRPGPLAETLVIESNFGQGAIDRSEPRLSLRGTGVGPDLQYAPAVLRFGSIEVGRPDTQRVILTNSGNDTLLVRNVSVDDLSFAVGTIDSIFLPGSERDVSVFYTPSDFGPRLDTLKIETNVLGMETIHVPLKALEVPRNLGTAEITFERADSLTVPVVGDTVTVDVRINPGGVSIEGADLFVRIDPQFFEPLNRDDPFLVEGAVSAAMILVNRYNAADGVLSLSAFLTNALTAEGVLTRLRLVVKDVLQDATAIVVLNEFPSRNSQYISGGMSFTLRPPVDLALGDEPPRLLLFPVLETGEDTAASVVVNALVRDPDTPIEELFWTTADSAFAVSVTSSFGTSIARFFLPEDAFGTFHVPTIVRDLAGSADTTDVVIVVRPVNDPPTVDTVTVQLRGQSTIRFPVLDGAHDVDGDELRLGTVSADAGAAVANADGTVTYTTADGAASDSLRFQVVDTQGGTASGVVVLVVEGENQLPEISGLPSPVVTPGEFFTLDLDPFVSDGDDPAESLVWSEEGFEGVASDVRIIGSLLEIEVLEEEGEVTVELVVIDPFGGAATASIVVAVIGDRFGDFNEDGEVRLADFFAFGSAWGALVGEPHYDVIYDLDEDGEVGFTDLIMWLPNFGRVF